MIQEVLLGAIISFTLYRSQCTPHCPSKMNQLEFYGYKIHLHHWLISLVALPFVQHPFIKGLLVGGIIHGILMYDDWHQIIKST